MSLPTRLSLLLTWLLFYVPFELPLQLAAALVEHETLDADEVRKVIKGEPIRNITEVLAEDLTRISEESKS